jgi:histidine triad (HIT) family protein
MDMCIFCKIVNGTAKSWKVYEDEDVYAFLDIHPVNEYHTLVVPKKHYVNIFDIPESELKKVIGVVKTITNLYQQKLGITHVQLVNSSGSAAQQDVFHFHFHIIPRKRGDGQNIKWTTHPEWLTRFDTLLEKIME